MQHRLALEGWRFGRLVVLEKSHKGGRGEIYWRCQCDCGSTLSTRAASLRTGRTQSCGCLHKERISTHHMTGLPTFKSWESMKQRCTNPASPDFHNYGGRGITVCDSWLHSFDSFLADMGERPKGMTLGRIDNEKGYEPSNCAWVTARDQQRNRRNTRKILHNGAVKTIYELAEQTGLSPKLIGDRLYAGWDVSKVFATARRVKRT